MEYFGFLKELIEQMLPNKLSKLGYIFIFLVFVFIPWALNGGIFNEDVSLVSEETVPYFQTNTCDYSINSIVRDNFFNDKIEKYYFPIQNWGNRFPKTGRGTPSCLCSQTPKAISLSSG